jgi:hypothetical protein
MRRGRGRQRLVRSRLIAESRLANRGVPPPSSTGIVYPDLVDQAKRERLLHDRGTVQTDDLVARPLLGLLERADHAVGNESVTHPSSDIDMSQTTRAISSSSQGAVHRSG